MSLRVITLMLLLVCGPVAPAEKPAAPAQQPQFLGMLRLVPKLHDDSAWTDKENKIVERHFLRLQQDAASGKVILAGRTLEPGATTLGLVIFKAADLAAAQAYVAADPAVADGVMTAEVRPYAVAVLGARPSPPPTPK